MSNVFMKLSVHLRGEMATQLLDAAEKLGLAPGVIRSQSDGFLVPTEVHRYLFPSEYDEDGNVIVAEVPTPAADDFGDLSDDELEELTAP